LKKKILAGVLCFVIGGAVANGFTTYGHGVSSCGYWVSNRTAVNSDDDGWPSRVNRAWVVGFVSGAGYTSPSDLVEVDSSAINAYMDRYCAAHPLDRISVAASRLVDELLSTRR